MSKEHIKPSQFCMQKKKAVDLDTQEIEWTPEQKQELEDLYRGMSDTFQPGKIVKGTIAAVDSDGVLVDINYKSRGHIAKYEFSHHELKNFKVGQDIEVLLENLENPKGEVVLSYEQAKSMRAWDAIAKLYEENKPVEGIVTHKVKGGLSVDIGIPAFLPGSQIDLQRVTDFDQYVGQMITANIIKINKKRGNVIISRRKYLSSQRADVRKRVLDTLQEGQIIQGVVKNITSYGVFIDIGGVDGLLHIIDMTWGRIGHPSEMVKIGDKITVKVLSFDKENEKISLGLKQLSENPWSTISETIKVGDRIKGKISSIADYGFFVEVAKGIEGLVHISEISWTDRITNLNSRFKVGDEIEVYVVSIDTENRRMSLSIKQLEKNPWEDVNQQFHIGQKIRGKISNVTDFGVFVRLLPGIDGLVHISDLSWTEHIDHPSHYYKIGQEVEAVVLNIDKDNKKVSLGIKQLQRDPWENVEVEYPVGSLVEGEVSKVAPFGAFIKLASGIEGLVHNTTLVEDTGKKAEEIFKIGQKETFRVVHVSKEENRLGLSTRLEGPRTETKKQQEKQVKHVKKEAVVEKPQQQASRAKSSLQLALENAMQQRTQDEPSEPKDKKTDDTHKESK
jgi:small subunit ribosomal protein S1